MYRKKWFEDDEEPAPFPEDGCTLQDAGLKHGDMIFLENTGLSEEKEDSINSPAATPLRRGSSSSVVSDLPSDMVPIRFAGVDLDELEQVRWKATMADSSSMTLDLLKKSASEIHAMIARKGLVRVEGDVLVPNRYVFVFNPVSSVFQEEGALCPVLSG